LKPAYILRKDNRISNPAITYYKCILCGQTICHDKRYTDRKGKLIPLDQTGKNHHDCPCLDYERNELKKTDFANHNLDNSTIGECQPRQTSLWEFMDGEGASNESNHEVVNKGIRPTTRTEPKEDVAIS
jgi:hypothetical protein